MNCFCVIFSFFMKQTHLYYLHALQKNVKNNTEGFHFFPRFLSMLDLIAAQFC